MKMQLVSLTLENFKCHEHLEIRFDGRNAAIYGQNAAGKSSIYDGLTWLLFGKDSHGWAASWRKRPPWSTPTSVWRNCGRRPPPHPMS